MLLSKTWFFYVRHINSMLVHHHKPIIIFKVKYCFFQKSTANMLSSMLYSMEKKQNSSIHFRCSGPYNSLHTICVNNSSLNQPKVRLKGSVSAAQVQLGCQGSAAGISFCVEDRCVGSTWRVRGKGLKVQLSKCRGAQHQARLSEGQVAVKVTFWCEMSVSTTVPWNYSLSIANILRRTITDKWDLLVFTWKTRGGPPNDLFTITVVMATWWRHEWCHVQLLWEWNIGWDLLVIACGMLETLQDRINQDQQFKYYCSELINGQI